MRLIHFNSNIIINLFEPRWSREATFMTRKVIKACNLKRSGVSIGDVLMAMIGTIGNPVIIKNDKEFAIKNVALFKVKENQSSDFLKYYLDSAFVKNKMLKDSKGTTQQFVGLGYLRNFPI